MQAAIARLSDKYPPCIMKTPAPIVTHSRPEQSNDYTTILSIHRYYYTSQSIGSGLRVATRIVYTMACFKAQLTTHCTSKALDSDQFCILHGYKSFQTFQTVIEDFPDSAEAL